MDVFGSRPSLSDLQARACDVLPSDLSGKRDLVMRPSLLITPLLSAGLSFGNKARLAEALDRELGTSYPQHHTLPSSTINLNFRIPDRL